MLVHTIRMRRLVEASRLAMLLLSLTLANGMVASSLLVECIPADGRSLVELFGQDPCHHPFGAIEIHDGDHQAATLQMENDPTDPCVDLSLDSLGISAGVVELHAPSDSAPDHLADASPLAGVMCLALRAGTVLKLAREPVNPADGDSQLLLSLRI